MTNTYFSSEVTVWNDKIPQFKDCTDLYQGWGMVLFLVIKFLVICSPELSASMYSTPLYISSFSHKSTRKDSQSLTSLFSELFLKSKVPKTFCLTFWSQEKFGSKKLV